MGILPVPAKVFFFDFSFNLVEYQIKRNNQVVSVSKGLKNKSHGKHYVSFLIDTDVKVGDILESDDETFFVSEILYDAYNGEKQIINAVYLS